MQVVLSPQIQTSFQDMGESPRGPICNKPEYKTFSLCLSDSGSSGLGGRRPEHPMGKPGRLCIPPTPLLPKIVQKL